MTHPDTRTAFEAWAQSQHIDITRDGFGGYESEWTEGASEGWQAAQAQAAAEPVATVNVFDPDGRGLKDWEFVGPITFYDLPHGKHLLYITPPAHTEAMRLALDKLWIIVEHNKLHFGDAHNTVMAGIVAIAALEGAMK